MNGSRRLFRRAPLRGECEAFAALLGTIVAARYTLSSEDGKETHCRFNTAVCETKEKAPVNNKLPEQVARLRMCGAWCQTAAEDAPCRIDTRRVPCQGSFCETTARFWTQFVLHRTRPVSCDLYKQGTAYPDAAAPCAACCQIPEINPARYPQPTGLGVFCKLGTCRPAASPRHATDSGLGILQCPCNWFGSECTTDWMTLESLTKTTISQSLIRLRLQVHDPTNRLLSEARPGSVIRLQQPSDEKDDTAMIYELSCAVARSDRQGETTTHVEVLVAQPSAHLDTSMCHLAEQLRALPDGVHAANELPPLYANPVISGFYNSRYQYLLDYLQAAKTPPQDVVVVATGSALSGALSAIERLLEEQAEGRLPAHTKLHLYYGLRHAADMPYRDRLEELAHQGKLQLTLVESSSPSENNRPSNGSKCYVQHAVESDLEQQVFASDGSVYIVCGHLAAMDYIRNLLPPKSQDLRFFLNI
jgi:hypothetical protein